jgi:type I site-specific restriction-modification system R (restriction) subunit
LIDHENPANNLYNYGHETLFKGNPLGSKPDFTLFINGIPIVIIEAKREFADYDTCLEAVKDIEEYEKRSPKLFNFIQFGIAYGDEIRKERSKEENRNLEESGKDRKYIKHGIYHTKKFEEELKKILRGD